MLQFEGVPITRTNADKKLILTRERLIRPIKKKLNSVLV